MTYAWREIIPTQTGVFSAAWIIDAPWAHPVWSQYLLALYDLTTPAPEAGTVVFYMPGATHEFVLHALDPEQLIPKDAPIQGSGYRPLIPPNYGYQFKADSDEAALARVQELVDGIVAQKLSPDTDFRSLWNKLLADAYPLVH